LIDEAQPIDRIKQISTKTMIKNLNLKSKKNKFTVRDRNERP